MSEYTKSDTTSSAIPYLKLRIALAAFSIASVFLPLASVKTFGVSIGISLSDAAGAMAYLIPLFCIVSLVAAYHPPLRQHSQLADKIATGVLAFFFVWGVWKIIQLISQTMELNNQMKALSGQSIPFGNIGSNALDFVDPSVGIIALIGTYVLGIMLFLKTRKSSKDAGQKVA